MLEIQKATCLIYVLNLMYCFVQLDNILLSFNRIKDFQEEEHFMLMFKNFSENFVFISSFHKVDNTLPIIFF